MAVLFDTRAFQRTLTEAGVSGGIANAHTRAVEAALEGGVATKQDVREVRQELKQDIQDVKQEIKLVCRDIEIQSHDLKLWFGSALVVLLGLLLAGGRLFWK